MEEKGKRGQVRERRWNNLHNKLTGMLPNLFFVGGAVLEKERVVSSRNKYFLIVCKYRTRVGQLGK